MLGIVVSFVALTLSVHFVGPAVRSVLGEPSGYDGDYAVPSALVHSMAIRLGSLACVFAVVGAVLSRCGVRESLSLALTVVNPVSVGLGYCLYQACWSGEYAGEYFGYGGLGMVALLAPFVAAPALRLGLRIRTRS